MQKAENPHNATHLAEERGVDPLAERERPLRRENANGAFVVLVRKANDDNLSGFPLVGDEGVMSNLGGAIGAVVAQDLNSFFNGDDRNSVQESLENSDGRTTNVKRVGICNGVCVHFVLEGKRWCVYAARAFPCRRHHRWPPQQVRECCSYLQ